MQSGLAGDLPMNRTLPFAALFVLAATAAFAQSSDYRSSPPSSSSFNIGARYSSYSTKFTGNATPELQTGRQSSFGIMGDYRNGRLVFDFNYDYDPSNGVGITDLILDSSDYRRSRTEVTAGYAIAPVLDLQVGARFETVRVGGFSLFGNTIGSDFTMDHQAIAAGVKLHSATDRPAGFYVLGRAYVGSAKFNDESSRDKTTTGYRAEVGIPIALGESNWSVVPGFEYEHIQTENFSFFGDRSVRLDTNRAFIGFAYRSRR
jgi:hypothetical protein